MATPMVPTSVKFEVLQTNPTVLKVTGSDGIDYEVKMALLIQSVIDTGMKNPLDGLPVLQSAAQVITQIKLWTNA